jgi:hypothetical protein
MGLDIYAGPLSRYYAGDWETIIQRHGRESGTPVHIIRPPGFRFPPPDVALARVLAWRSALDGALDGHIHEPLNWSESLTGDYITDKPNHDGKAGVVLLAAQQEFPSMSLPTRATRDASRTNLWTLVADRYGSGNLRRRIRKRLGMPVPAKPSAPFEHIYFPILWLPVEMGLSVVTKDAFGHRVTIGSVLGLRRELQDLHDRIRASRPSLLDAWQSTDALDRGEFEAIASLGLKIWLELAIQADDRRVPMILDW